MEEEYIKYRKASFKGKLGIAKKFSKFYINDFTPLTKLEEEDVKKSLRSYRVYTFFGAMALGWISFNAKKIRFGVMEAHEAPRDHNMRLTVL